MLRYLLNRILIAVPTLVIISVVIFYMSKIIPQDPVLALLNYRGVDNAIKNDAQYERIYKELNLNKPSFYFSVLPNNYPKNLNKIVDSNLRGLAKTLANQGFDGRDVLNAIDEFDKLKQKFEEEKNTQQLIEINKLFLKDEIIDLTFLPSLRNAKRIKFYYPKIFWHGGENQYHLWLSNILDGSFGISIADGKKALDKVKKAMTWTLSFTLLEFFLSLFLSVLIGVFLAYNPNGKSQIIVNQILYLLYSIPIFWMATMLVVYFTTDDYGLNIFPSVGIDIYPGKSTIEQIGLNYKKLILPILCIALHSLAYITRFVRRSLMDEMQKDYASLAYSKGLTKKEVIRKHALKNSLIPLITTLAKSFAAAFGGVLVIEIVFNIPGVGRLLVNSIDYGDWNVIFCITLILSFITIISFIIADILYSIVSPKVQLNSNMK